MLHAMYLSGARTTARLPCSGGLRPPKANPTRRIAPQASCRGALRAPVRHDPAVTDSRYRSRPRVLA